MRVAGVMLAGVAMCTACSSSGGPDGNAMSSYPADNRPDLERIRDATTAFRSINGAVEAGYPGAVAQCVSHAEHGAMGYHHMNRSLLDDRVELERPEILLYSHSARGEYVLNGVEYIVPYSVHPREAEPPAVMGQPLKRSDALRIWYLHVWAWAENPAGLFADWNPAVTCRSAS